MSNQGSEHELVVAHGHVVAAGAALAVCSQACLDLRNTREWAEDYELIALDGRIARVRCCSCGSLVTQPDRWCAGRGINAQRHARR